MGAPSRYIYAKELRSSSSRRGGPCSRQDLEEVTRHEESRIEESRSNHRSRYGGAHLHGGRLCGDPGQHQRRRELHDQIGVGRITFNTGGAFDGQVGAFYNLRNDRSGNCDGDHGQINVKYTAGTIAAYQIACAHYSNCRSFSVDYIDTFLDPTGNTYVIVRAINVKPPAKDRIQIGVTTDPALAQDWVNLGYVTGGAFADGHVFPEVPCDNGNWTIQPKPLDCTPPA